MPIISRTVKLSGREVSIAGNDADPYFQAIDAFAAQTKLLSRFVAKHVDDGWIVDVGANIGLTSIAMTLAAPSSRVLAFEPSPKNVALLEVNTRPHDRIQIERSGVGDAEGVLNLVEPPAGANCHIATPEYEYAASAGFLPVRVPVTTLDHYFESARSQHRVALIKIDVEGFEPNVLAGAKSLLERQHPLIWMEFNSVTLNVAQGYSPMAFARALFDCFEVMRVNHEGDLLPVPSAGALVHDNITLHGSIEDIVLRPRPRCDIPTVEFMTVSRTVHAELERLRRRSGEPGIG